MSHPARAEGLGKCILFSDIKGFQSGFIDQKLRVFSQINQSQWNDKESPDQNGHTSHPKNFEHDRGDRKCHNEMPKFPFGRRKCFTWNVTCENIFDQIHFLILTTTPHSVATKLRKLSIWNTLTLSDRHIFKPTTYETTRICGDGTDIHIQENHTS